MPPRGFLVSADQEPAGKCGNAPLGVIPGRGQAHPGSGFVGKISTGDGDAPADIANIFSREDFAFRA